jgi:hypothetical protein
MNIDSVTFGLFIGYFSGYFSAMLVVHLQEKEKARERQKHSGTNQ